jgi:F420-non-reducing hydrogenase iron-sulfur subunit
METIPEQRAIAVFVCANCARQGKAPSSSGRSRPVVPDFNWPIPFKQVVVPCTGRLQPEHVLKAFESGASVVSVIACQDDNCHYVEGSPRCTRRIDYIRSLLNEIGLGEERLLLFHLPGSASEDLAMSAGKASSKEDQDSINDQIAAIRKRAIEVLGSHPPNPLQGSGGLNGDFNLEETVCDEEGSDE